MIYRLLGSAGSLLLTLGLLGGLINFPVTCACGAHVPHGHSLFQMAGHHHGPAGHDHDHEHDGHAQTVVTTPLTEPGEQSLAHLSSAADPGSASAPAAALVALALPQAPGQRQPAADVHRSLHGRSVVPDAPPPQRI